jgi:hypothetical protein
MVIHFVLLIITFAIIIGAIAVVLCEPINVVFHHEKKGESEK